MGDKTNWSAPPVGAAVVTALPARQTGGFRHCRAEMRDRAEVRGPRGACKRRGTSNLSAAPRVGNRCGLTRRFRHPDTCACACACARYCGYPTMRAAMVDEGVARGATTTQTLIVGGDTAAPPYEAVAIRPSSAGLDSNGLLGTTRTL